MPKAAASDIRDAIRKIESLHGNMAVLSRLGPLLKDPNSDIDDAARLIQTDGALAGSIIKISNSAFYGSGQRSLDVRSALNKVGFNEALRLVGMALSQQVFMRDLSVYGITADDYWSHSYLSGLLLEAFASRLGLDKDDAYMLGLLHAIGKVVLNELLEAEAVDVFWDPTFSSEEWEDIMFGFHYDEAGAVLLENWKFPESIFGRVAKQLDPVQIAGDNLLGGLDFIRETFSLNSFEFDKDNWKVPHEHPFLTKTKTSPEGAKEELVESRKKMKEIRQTIGGRGS